MYRSRNEQLLDSSSIVIDDQQGSPVKPDLPGQALDHPLAPHVTHLPAVV